jgi:hypothetical protein
MGAEILLINPITKRGKKMAKAKRKKPRTAAQKAATKKMLAANKRKAPKRRKASKVAKKRRAKKSVSKPATRKVTALRSTSRGKPLTARGKSRMAKNRKRKIKGYFPNPIKLPALGGIGTTVNDTVMPAFVGATGAIALDIVWGKVAPMLPAQMKDGNVKYLAKGLGAIALTFAAGKVMSRQKAQVAGVGMLTVIIHEFAKATITKQYPALMLGEYVGAAPVYLTNDSGDFPTMSGYDADMGEYVPAVGEYVGEADYSDADNEGFEF